MPALRIAVVGVPSLLADIIRFGLGSRLADVTVTELAELEHARAPLHDVDAVIVGPLASEADTTLIRKIVPQAQILIVSPDLSRFADLDTGTQIKLTSDALVEHLRR